MRKIDTRDFRRATRHTSREVNRQIVLNIIREHQPISRADLARRMDVARSVMTHLVGELVESGAVHEAAAVPAPRGRPPKLLTMGGDRCAVAVDVGAATTDVALGDLTGRLLARARLATPATPAGLVDALPPMIGALLGARACAGVGISVPGIIEDRDGRVLLAPRLGWRDVPLAAAVGERLGMAVRVAGASVAAALAHLWLAPAQPGGARSFAYAMVSDGVGVGLVLDGAPLRGEAHAGSEFGHITLDASGPSCACGRRGCWEAFACNAATVARYVHRAAGTRNARGGQTTLTIRDVIDRARRGDAHAGAALAETGHCIGRGLATVVSAFGPGRIHVGGEIAAAWDLVEPPLRAALAEHTLTSAARATPVVPDPRAADSRLLGAAALVLAPTFAAPRVA